MSEKLIRTRFGIRLPVVPKAAIFILHLKESDFKKMQDLVATMKVIIAASGRPEIAARIVFESS